MQGYFSYLPNINYVSRSNDRSASDEIIPVKNIFKRAKIRDDMKNVVTAFEDFIIEGDLRPEQLARKMYGDPRFDWVILTVNNITKVRDQWPLTGIDFRKYCLDKYGSDDELAKVHHYETSQVLDYASRIVLPNGLKVDSNFELRYLQRTEQVQEVKRVSGGNVPQPEAVSYDSAGTARDANGNIITHSNVYPITNYEYEEEIINAKRRIKMVRPRFLNVIVSDMQRVMKYKKSSQFVTKRIKNVYNPRLSGGS